ncbi:MAG: hypothetical protein LBU89_02165 [Fibromonadaceae bacterium]|jgi:hypothetical protein|nr:hypothetical protein [Fibromonadaceae bacterium]
MTFALICDEYFQKKVSGIWFNGEIPNHKVVNMTADNLLETGKLPEGISAVLIERATWQKNFSMFRYFNMLPLLEEKVLAFIASTPEPELKGRGAMRGKEFIFPNGINADDASAQLTRLLELAPPAFTHPKPKVLA